MKDEHSHITNALPLIAQELTEFLDEQHPDQFVDLQIHAELNEDRHAWVVEAMADWKGPKPPWAVSDQVVATSGFYEKGLFTGQAGRRCIAHRLARDLLRAVRRAIEAADG